MASEGAFANSNSLAKEPRLTVIKDTAEHKVIHFDNKDVLDVVYEDGKTYSYVKTEGENLKIFKENDKLFIIDTDTNETIDTITIEVEEEPSNLLDKDTEMGTMAIPGPTPGGGSFLKYSHTAKLSIDIVGLSAGVAAGLIAAAIGLSGATSVITGIATDAVTYLLPKLYWKRHIYRGISGMYMHTQYVNQFYKYHDYTGYLGVEYAHAKARIR